MARYRLLLVDKDPAAAQSVYGTLSGDIDLELVQAFSAAEAQEQVSSRQFDLLLINMELEDTSGVELCRLFKAEMSSRAIPVVIISPHDSESNIELSFKAGASSYVAKGDILERLPETVHQLLKKQDYQQGRVILVVDDAPIVCDIVEEALSFSGFHILKAYGGRNALELLQENIPDLIISDVSMPDLDGFGLLKELRAIPEYSSIPFMAMSGHSDRSYLKRMMQLGVDAYIVKPFSMDQLVLQVEKILANNYTMLLRKREFLEKERDMLLETITSLVAALEARDPYTSGHSANVARIVSEMVLLAGGSPADAETTYLGGRLHDIGKIGIPDAILLKPGPLDDKELALIQQHPSIGAHILEPISSFSNIVSIVLYHHEHFDGTGYPQGLKGRDIPYWARMTAVADVYDALSSDRPYRPKMSLEQTLQVINHMRGKQLCPECTDIFMEWIKQQKGGSPHEKN